MKKIFLLSSFGLMSLGIFAQEQVDNKIHGSVSLSHTKGFYKDSDPVSNLTLGLGFKLSEKSSLGLSQKVTKQFVIDAGDSEFKFHDTKATYDYSMNETAGLSLTFLIPISDYSQDTGRVTTGVASISIGKSFFNEKLNLSYSPYLSYSVNKYQTDRAGKPLDQFGIGNGISINLGLSEKMSLTGTAELGLNFKEKLPHQIGEQISDDGFYSYTFVASYQVQENLSFSAGYTQGDVQLNNGVKETYLFDRENSLAFAAVKLKF